MSTAALHRMPWASLSARDNTLLLTREWLVTNGLGGYASGTISGACTRRFHGLLIAALPAPLGRYMALHHLDEVGITPDETVVRLGGHTRNDVLSDAFCAGDVLSEFRLENGLPTWHYRTDVIDIEKRIVMPHMQNTVHVIYRGGQSTRSIRLQLRPSFQLRPHEGKVEPEHDQVCTVQIVGDKWQIRSDTLPPIRMRVVGAAMCFVHDGGRRTAIEYDIERARGYDYRGSMGSPGYFEVDLSPGETVTLTASTEEWDSILATDPFATFQTELQRRETLVRQADPAAREGVAAQLVLAADQFIIRPNTRMSDSAVAHASGDHARTVIAGYHWFTDWGRDTMISLEGLTLTTGRYAEAGYLLRTFARYVKDGLIPNHFPEGSTEPAYHTADASLWYFHALARYLAATDDRQTLQVVLPALQEIADRHLQGTRFGIHVDPSDGLLVQGEDGYQLTWMDAKVDGWVVTPRRGKAVEINALWHNALCLLAKWQLAAGNASIATALTDHARRVQTAFNHRFWNPARHCLFDVVDGADGDDAAVRPNQIFAISLDCAVLDSAKWAAVVNCVSTELLTPFGLRTLSRDHPDYKANYEGDLRSRDAAYHQGTVWPWLLGHFVDAWLKVYPDRPHDAIALLKPLEEHLGEAGIGSISEIFEAESPYYPRGCAAQAWSVAEILRAHVKCQNFNNPPLSIEEACQ
jgi:predicted glycogen debranching enzyme